MQAAPDLTDADPIDLAVLPVDADDTVLECIPDTLPHMATTPASPSSDHLALAGRIAESVYALADEADRIPGLQARKDEIQGLMHAVQREYTASQRAASARFSEQMSPLADEINSIETAIESALKAKDRLEKLAKPDSPLETVKD